MQDHILWYQSAIRLLLWFLLFSVSLYGLKSNKDDNIKLFCMVLILLMYCFTCYLYQQIHLTVIITIVCQIMALWLLLMQDICSQVLTLSHLPKLSLFSLFGSPNEWKATYSDVFYELVKKQPDQVNATCFKGSLVNSIALILVYLIGYYWKSRDVICYLQVKLVVYNLPNNHYQQFRILVFTEVDQSEIFKSFKLCRRSRRHYVRKLRTHVSTVPLRNVITTREFPMRSVAKSLSIIEQLDAMQQNVDQFSNCI
jgi:hypothetical protein